MGQRISPKQFIEFLPIGVYQNNRRRVGALQRISRRTPAQAVFIVFRDAQDRKCRRSHLEPFCGAFVFRQGFILPNTEKAIVGHSVRSKTKIQKIKISFQQGRRRSRFFLKYLYYHFFFSPIR